MITIITGLPGSGKSYFAGYLSKLTGAEYIGSDKIRFQIIKTPCYSDREKQQVYDAILQLTLRHARAGTNVVLDASFYSKDLRRMFSQALAGTQRIVWIEVVAEERLIRERLRRNLIFSSEAPTITWRRC
jgi:predicted kinase